MNPFEMVAVIIVAVMVASVLRSYFKHRGEPPAGGDAEALRLREEVKTLRERITVLERITVDKENSLERQIEELRDR